jgi:hypothetical protein
MFRWRIEVVKAVMQMPNPEYVIIEKSGMFDALCLRVSAIPSSDSSAE